MRWKFCGAVILIALGIAAQGIRTPAEAPTGTADELKAEILRLREENLRLKEEVAALTLQAQRPPPPPAGQLRRPPPQGPADPPQDDRLVNPCLFLESTG